MQFRQFIISTDDKMRPQFYEGYQYGFGYSIEAAYKFKTYQTAKRVCEKLQQKYYWKNLKVTINYLEKFQ